MLFKLSRTIGTLKQLCYADSITIYSYLNSKSGIIDKTKLAASLEKDLQPVVDWGRKWLVNFNASKMKLLSFTHHREPSLPPIPMADAQLHESAPLYLLGLTLSTDMRGNKYIDSIGSSTTRKVGSLCHARKFFSSESILQIYKSTIYPCMEYYCHIWSGPPVVSPRQKRQICYVIGPDLASSLVAFSQMCHGFLLSLL